MDLPLVATYLIDSNLRHPDFTVAIWEPIKNATLTIVKDNVINLYTALRSIHMFFKGGLQL